MKKSDLQGFVISFLTLAVCVSVLAGQQGPGPATTPLVATKVCSGCANTQEAPSITADGRSIAADGRTRIVADNAEGIGIRDLQSGQTTWVRKPATEIAPANVRGAGRARPIDRFREPILSPDQKRIAFVLNFDQLFIMMNEPGATPRSLMTIPQTATKPSIRSWVWAPDSKSVLVEFEDAGPNPPARSERNPRAPSQLVWVSASDGAVRPLLSVGPRPLVSAGVSPNGQYIVYVTRPATSAVGVPGPAQIAETESRIYIHAANGAGPETEVVNQLGITHVWMPDDVHVLFASNSDLWVVSIKDGKASGSASLVANGVGALPVGVSGSRYYYVAPNRMDIWALELKLAAAPVAPAGAQNQGSVEPRVGNTVSGVKVAAPGSVVSGTGSCSNATARGGNNSFCLYSVEIDRTTGKARGASPLFGISFGAIPGGNNLTTSLSVSNDGKTVAFFSNGPGNRVTVFSGPLERGPDRAYTLPLQLSSLMWFPDHKSLLTTRVIGGDEGVVAANKSGDREQGIALGRFDVADGTYTELARTPDRWVAAAISPDGQFAYAVRGQAVATDSILVVPLGTGAQNRSLLLPTDKQGIFGLALTPDGLTFAISVLDQRTDRAWISRAALDGTGYRELYVYTDRTFFPRMQWTPDGRALLFGRRANSGSFQILRVTAEGGTPVFTGLEVANLTSIQTSPDGSHLFVVGRSASISTPAAN